MTRINTQSRFFEQFADLPFDHKWKDVLTIINGKAYGEEYKVSGTYPICGSGGIMGYGEKKLCNRDSIILGRKGNIDKPIYMSEDYWIVDTAFCLSPNTELIHPVYLYHWCKQFDFQKLNKQAVLPSLTRTDLEQIDIQVPEMAEQLAFVAIVRQADKSKFSGFKSRFIEMFGDPNSNPRCLPTGLVSDCFTLQMGKTPARDTARYWVKDGSGNKWISIADMSRYEYFTNDTEEYISESAIQETGMKLIPKNIVIMSFKLTIGRVSVTSEPIYSNEAIVAFIPKTQDYSTRFLYYLVKYYDWLENAALAVKGKTLNKESIGKNRLIIPSRESQNEFATFAEQADKSK